MKRKSAVRSAPSSASSASSTPTRQMIIDSGDQHGGVREPPELQPLDAPGAAKAHADRDGASHEAGEYPEESEGPERLERSWERRQRPVDVLVGSLERLGVEEAEDQEGDERDGAADRPAPPASRGQPAIREDEHDREQDRVQQRPRRLIPEDRPRGARQRAGLLEDGVLRVGGRDADAGEQQRVGEEEPADRMLGTPHGRGRARPRARRG